MVVGGLSGAEEGGHCEGEILKRLGRAPGVENHW